MMLVLLIGPSGVGKSAVIKKLIQEHSWTPLVSLVTRPERDEDPFKVSISECQYDTLRDTGKLWSDVLQGVHRYALLRSDVELAIHSSQLFVVDFALPSLKNYFSKVPHVLIYIAAEDFTSLESRLRSAGRVDRLESSLRSAREIESWYSAEGSLNDVVRLVNKTGHLDEVVAALVKVVKQRL